jgi:hypothetical protein
MLFQNIVRCNQVAKSDNSAKVKICFKSDVRNSRREHVEARDQNLKQGYGQSLKSSREVKLNQTH